jgi:hypothetical protein
MPDPMAEVLLRLDGVKQVKPDTWQAKCPAHNDRNPSLSVSRGEDGRVLLKCWAGCGAADIVQAVGLTLADLFERDTQRHVTPTRKRPHADLRHVLRLVHHEVEVVCLAAADLANNKPLSDGDLVAVRRARLNLQKALDAANV